jgi:hypothetical protein
VKCGHEREIEFDATANAYVHKDDRKPCDNLVEVRAPGNRKLPAKAREEMS